MISIEQIYDYTLKSGLELEFTARSRNKCTIKVYKHSPTAQPAYEYQQMFSSTGGYKKVCEEAFAWLLQHRAAVRNNGILVAYD